MLTLDKFKEARSVLQGVIAKTDLVYSPYFSELYGNQVYLKPENMQVTGAYKIRGAYYKTTRLTEEQKAHGLITASAGNHAQGVAYAAKVAGLRATVVMPTTTPLMKVNRTKQYGAEVILHGGVFDDAAEYAMQLAEEPLPMRSSSPCRMWTSYWCPLAAADWRRASPLWQSC
jgi:threonine dehydratase